MNSHHHALNASTPRHLYGLVDGGILRGKVEDGTDFDRCVIFGVTSIPSRALHFSIMTEAGSQWARIPIHKLRHELPTGPCHPLNELQSWDCHGWEFSVTAYEYLREMACTVKTRSGKILEASYWFTLDHTDNGWSQYPAEHKCYHILLLHDGSGQIVAQPNNRIVWKDDSFVRKNDGVFSSYRVMPAKTWHAETGHNADLNALTK